MQDHWTFFLANEHGDKKLFHIKIAAKNKEAVIAAYNSLSINPQYSIGEIQASDILIIPGGDDLSEVLADEETIQWVSTLAHGAEQVLSVCSGSKFTVGIRNGSLIIEQTACTIVRHNDPANPSIRFKKSHAQRLLLTNTILGKYPGHPHNSKLWRLMIDD